MKAVLGPTNTGKTHLAMERLLAHGSGIIGFPLRLLARENYDRMVAPQGPEALVALITGEEKIVPPDARWFSCTVEAMPLDPINRTGADFGSADIPRPEFLAVDEIQLCADPRPRLRLHRPPAARTRHWWRPCSSARKPSAPCCSALVPQAEIETRPRLSQPDLHAGPAKLTKLPPRSAVVAFSAGRGLRHRRADPQAARRLRGGDGPPVSPRTRNAQVALYQDKEVDFLVATDAIGMGLNMDVEPRRLRRPVRSSTATAPAA